MPKAGAGKLAQGRGGDCTGSRQPAEFSFRRCGPLQGDTGFRQSGTNPLLTDSCSLILIAY